MEHKLKRYLTSIFRTEPSLRMPTSDHPSSVAGIRVLHAATLMPNKFDVFINGKRLVHQLPYGAMTNYVIVKEGDNYIQVSRSDDPSGAFLSQILSLREGKLCTLAFIDQTHGSKIPRLLVISDQIESEMGEGQIRFINLSTNSPSFDLLVNGEIGFRNVPYTHLTKYTRLSPGIKNLQVQVTGARVLLTNLTASIQMDSRRVMSAITIGGHKPYEYQLLIVQDR